MWEDKMQVPLQIAFHGVDHSDAVEERVQAKVQKLEHIFNRITSCKVVVESLHRNPNITHHKGVSFNVRIDLKVPGSELVVRRSPKNSHEHEDIYVAMRDAFLAMERQLRNYVGRIRRESHAV